MKCVNFEHFDATRQIRLPAFHDARAARRAFDLSHIATFEQSNHDIQIEASTDFNDGPQSLIFTNQATTSRRALRGVATSALAVLTKRLHGFKK